MTETTAARPLSSPRARWAVSGVVAVGIAVALVVPPMLASADTAGLPETTPADLLVAMAEAEPAPLSGTVVHTARLGLPDLALGEMTGADPIALLGGSSTLRIWTDGAERSRVALLGSMSEYSVVTDGPEAWTYSSADNEARHLTLDEEDRARWDAMDPGAKAAARADGALPTPAEAAEAVLTRAEEHSTVALVDQVTLAGRAAYQLAVTPDSDTTLVSRIVMAVDGETSTPLRVQIWSRQDSGAPALEIGFTDVTFAMPDDSVFTFTPPADAVVTEKVVPLPDPPATPHTEADAASRDQVTVAGEGWDTVVELSGVDVAGLLAGDPASLATLPDARPTVGSQSAQDLVEEFAPADGSGRRGLPDLDAAALYLQLTTEVPEGRLLASTLLSVLATNDGRVLIGAVPPDVLRAMA